MKQDFLLNDLPCEAELCPSTLTYRLSGLTSFPLDCFHIERKAIWRGISIIRSHFWNTRHHFNKRASIKVIEVSYQHLAAVSQPSDTQAKPKNLLSLPSAQIYLQQFFLFVIVSLSDKQTLLSSTVYLLFHKSQWSIIGLMIVKAKKASLDQNPTVFLCKSLSRSRTLRFNCCTWIKHFLVSDRSLPM